MASSTEFYVLIQFK